MLSHQNALIRLRDRLSIATLFRAFWGKIAITWGLTLLETFLFALLPLLIGHAIDGLLQGNHEPFTTFVLTLGFVVIAATARRFYDTRAYGTMRVELSKALIQRSGERKVSVTNARALMGRELVDFLEIQAPESMTALIQVLVSVVLLFTFDAILALSAGLATLAIILIYSFAARRFFKVNQALNAQTEQQVSALESRDLRKVTLHFLRLRREEVRLSDTESIVYGLIFCALLTMLAFNLWFAATGTNTSPGSIFSIVTYSFEFVESAVALPVLLQSLTRLQEITQRINEPPAPESTDD